IIGVMDTRAALPGVAMSSGQDTACWFNYGASTNYGSATPAVGIGGSNLSPVFITNFITGLTPGVQYHAQLIATNALGTNAGGDMTFTTLLPSATFITATSASLNCT